MTREDIPNREYKNEGTVKISVKEYRDLITDVAYFAAKAQSEKDEAMGYWRRANAAEEAVDEYKAFFKENPVERVKFHEWQAEREQKKEETKE